VSGEPVALAPNYHSQVYDYDDIGNLVEVSYFASDGSTASHPFNPGVYRTEYSYTDTGKRFEITSEKAFGLDNKPTIKDNWHVNFPPMFDHISTGGLGQSIKGVHRVEKELYENGKDKSASFYGVDGEPTTDYHNVNAYKFEWLDSYYLTSITAINYDRELIKGFFPGYVRLEYAYNDEGSFKSKALYGENGEPLALEEGVHKMTIEERSPSESGIKYFDVNGKPIEGRFLLCW